VSIRFSLQLGDKTTLPLDKEELIIGRSADCDITIKDPYISRRQARIILEQDQAFIENLGRNPILINGDPTQHSQLTAGHVIQLGSTELVVQAIEDSPSPGVQEAQASPPMSEQTVFMPSSPRQAASQPHLLLSSDEGRTETIPLDKTPFSIGREPEADLQLEDQAVSRRHAVVESLDEECLLTNTSDVNPLEVNNEAVSRKQLFSGDRIQIGPYLLTFVSDRPEDQKPVQEVPGPLSPYHLGGIAVLVLIALVLGGYFAYSGIYKPWKMEQEIESASGLIKAGNHRRAVDRLEAILEKDLSPEQESRVQTLLADTVLEFTASMLESGDVSRARALLTSYVEQYGGTAGALPALERLDRIRLETGRHLESTKDYERALKEYAAVREGGPYADEARKGIRRIWLASQQKHLQQQSIAQLLKEAEQNFIAKRYLTPVNNNAYAAYQAVLSMDPDHDVALQRIEQMKSFYRQNGERHFQSGRFARALTYFERFAIIDPDNERIASRISACRSHLGQEPPTSKAPQTAPGQPEDKKYKEQVRKMLDESGAESSRIMKYLFEDAKGEGGSDSPW